MILKNSNILYLFDFDGTLCGEDHWYGFFKNTYRCFLRKPYIDPSKYDIRWSIITGRPKMDYFLVKLACMWHNLTPELIYTSDDWRYKYKNNEQNYHDKLKKIFKIFEGKIKFPRKIDKIFYIDNDLECIKYINSNRTDYKIISCTVKDFYEKEFLSIPI